MVYNILRRNIYALFCFVRGFSSLALRRSRASFAGDLR
jgi:hypothetical protein